MPTKSHSLRIDELPEHITMTPKGSNDYRIEGFIIFNPEGVPETCKSISSLRDLKTQFPLLESYHPFGIGCMAKTHIWFIARFIGYSAIVAF